MTEPLIPHAEMVAKAWLLAAVPGLSGNVATTLPDLPWYNDQFIQVMNVGGTPDPHVPQLNPVVTVNCFAASPGSTKPPWNKASSLAMAVWKATFQVRYAPDPAVELAMPSMYGRALCQSVLPVSDIKKLPSDPSQYAVFSLDLQFNWVPASVVIP